MATTTMGSAKNSSATSRAKTNAWIYWTIAAVVVAAVILFTMRRTAVDSEVAPTAVTETTNPEASTSMGTDPNVNRNGADQGNDMTGNGQGTVPGAGTGSSSGGGR